MDIMNKAPEPDRRPMSERIASARGCIELFVNKNLFPEIAPTGFNLHEFFKDLDGEERIEVDKVLGIIEQILTEEGLWETHPQFNLRKRLTILGKKVLVNGSYIFWLQDGQPGLYDTPTPVINYADNRSYTDKSTKINGDKNKVAVADNNATQDLSDADLNLAKNPIQNPTAKKTNRTMVIFQKVGLWIISHIWQSILAVLAAIIAAYLIYKLKIPH